MHILFIHIYLFIFECSVAILLFLISNQFTFQSSLLISPSKKSGMIFCDIVTKPFLLV